MDGIKDIIINQLIGKLGDDARTYSVYETHGPNDELPRTIFVFPKAYGEKLTYMELHKYSSFVLTAYQVTKDELNLYGIGYQFDNKLI